jgi:glycosyltransferase involved in cell wall biosynthesis
MLHSQRFLQWLQEDGYRVTFVDTTAPANLNGACTAYVPYPAALRGRLGRLNRQWRALWLHRLWRREQPDIVHVHWVDERAYECRLAGVHPLVLTCWGSDIRQHFEYGIDRRYTRRTMKALRYADWVLADSRHTLDQCQTLAGKRIRSTLMLLGIDTSRFGSPRMEIVSSLRAELGVPADAKLILSVRAWKREHQHDRIVRAFASIRSTLSRPSYLLLKHFNDEDDRYEDEIRSLAQELGVADGLRWLQGVPYERMPEVYGLSDVVVNFPFQDAFPISFLESAAAGKAIVTCDQPDYRGIIPDGLVRVVPSSNLEALAKAMADALRDDSWNALQNRARLQQWAVSVGDQRVSRQTLRETYDELLQAAQLKRDRVRRSFG